MTSEIRFLQIFECKTLSLNFVQNDCSKTKKKTVKRERVLSHALTVFLVCRGYSSGRAKTSSLTKLIGLIKGFDHLGRFRMEIDFI